MKWQIWEREGNEKNPFPEFGNGKGMKKTFPEFRNKDSYQGQIGIPFGHRVGLMRLLMIHEACMPVYRWSRFFLRARVRTGQSELVQEVLADLKTVPTTYSLFILFCFLFRYRPIPIEKKANTTKRSSKSDRFRTKKNGTLSGQIKILRPLL